MKRLSNILIGLGLSLIVIAAIFLINEKYKENDSYEISMANLEILDENLSNNKETVIDGNKYFGTISIPALDIYLPIIDNYSNENLYIAPCRYYGGIETNDLIICAHGYEKFFRYIKDLKQGDLIIIKDTHGEEYIYEVKLLEVIERTDVSSMVDNDFDLTLFTCTHSGLSRYTVRCNRIN